MDQSQSIFEDLVDNQDAQSLLVHIAIAESQPNVYQAVLQEIGKDRRWVPDVCTNYQDLFQTVNSQSSDLILLGKLEDLNWLEACRICVRQWQNLPVILLVDQIEVSSFFRDWAINRGVNDVVSIHPHNLHAFRKTLMRNVLQRTIKKSIDRQEQIASAMTLASNPLTSSSVDQVETLTWEATLVSLNRLTKYSSSYLGLLAIGNYWKKSQASLVALHPSLRYWAIDHQGHISCPFISEQIDPLTLEQLQDVQSWVRAFLKECERVIVDFSEILRSKSLSADVTKLLSVE